MRSAEHVEVVEGIAAATLGLRCEARAHLITQEADRAKDPRYFHMRGNQKRLFNSGFKTQFFERKMPPRTHSVRCIPYRAGA